MPSLNLLAILRRTLTSRGYFIFVLPASLILGITVVLSLFFFIRGTRVMQDQLGNHIKDLTVMGALQLVPADVEAIVYTPEDVTTQGVRQKLRKIISVSPFIRSASILKRNGSSSTLLYVAQEYSEVIAKDIRIATGATLDMTQFPVLLEKGFEEPVWVERIVDSLEGGFISGYTPLLDREGNAIALLEFNMDPQKLLIASQSIFSPFTFFAILLIGISCILLTELFIHQHHLVLKQMTEQSRLQFLAAASHQLRSPINTIRILHNSLLQEPDDPLPKSAQESLGDAERYAKQMNDTIDTMLHVSSLQSGTSTLQKKTISIPSLLLRIQGLCERESAAKQQKVVIDSPPDMQIVTDELILQEVLMQLLVNAIHYTPSKGRIFLRALRTQHGTHIEVEDTGYGIPNNEQKNLFQKFFSGSQADRNSTHGFGLYLVRTLTELLRGEIRFTSTVDKGTTFTVILPDAA